MNGPTLIRYKNRPMRPGWIWPNITIGVNVILEYILTLIRVRHIVSSKSVQGTEKM